MYMHPIGRQLLVLFLFVSQFVFSSGVAQAGWFDVLGSYNALDSLNGMKLKTSSVLETVDPSDFVTSVIHDISHWEPASGDYLKFDLSTNTGYLMSADNSVSFSFPVATGQKRRVNYIGLDYWAETPAREWIIKSEHIKSDHVTFGRTGRFLRLYADGHYTHYGIHPYRYIDRILTSSADFRYQSMGCILTTEEVMDVLDKIFVLNKDEGVRVVTYKGEAV